MIKPGTVSPMKWNVSKLIRRVHMYLALFLTPWMLMYALSTMAMNHSHFFDDWYGEPERVYETVDERALNIEFSEGVNNRQAAQQILDALGMNGAHGFNGTLENDRLVINRHNPVTPTRITFIPSSQKATIEEEVFRTPHVLERLHRTRGYKQDYWANDLWALIVDGVIISMVLWGLTGLWMWWELKITRRWGAIALAGGIALFSLFLFTI